MIRLGYHRFLPLLLAVLPATAAPRGKADSPAFRLAAVSPSVKPEMTRYSLTALENCDATNALKALLYTPKPIGMARLPMVVYLPGKGELGELEAQFRQRTIFDRVASAAFQEKSPCFLLAISPPKSASTLLGGMPKSPTGMQNAIKDFILEIARSQTKPKADLNRLYLTGFSYGGNGAYALAQHFPNVFAAVIPIAALPPLPEYFTKESPGSWWHFHNEGDYSRHGIDVQQIEEFAKLVNDAGGDFRIATYPAEGHDAWTKAWREDVVWDWAFSKSLDGKVRQLTKKGKRADPVSLSLSSAVCSASVPGLDSGHGPERVVDGLDATWYESKEPFEKDDWWQVDLQTTVRGRFVLVLGDERGGKRAKGVSVESSADGKRWSRVGVFSNKDGVCSFVPRGKIRYLRVRLSSEKPQTICLRRLKVIEDGK